MTGLKSRERKLIAASAAVVVGVLIHMLVVSPALKKRADLDNQINRARAQLVDLRLLEQEYDQILKETKEIKQRVSGRSRDFALFSFLD
jgi:type II secretory pathway component PulM